MVGLSNLSISTFSTMYIFPFFFFFFLIRYFSTQYFSCIQLHSLFHFYFFPSLLKDASFFQRVYVPYLCFKLERKTRRKRFPRASIKVQIKHAKLSYLWSRRNPKILKNGKLTWNKGQETVPRLQKHVWRNLWIQNDQNFQLAQQDLQFFRLQLSFRQPLPMHKYIKHQKSSQQSYTLYRIWKCLQSNITGTS